MQLAHTMILIPLRSQVIFFQEQQLLDTSHRTEKKLQVPFASPEASAT